MSPKPLNMDSEIKSRIMATPSYGAVSCLSVVEGREVEDREKGRIHKGGLKKKSVFPLKIPLLQNSDL
jgi:hypothetical protein